MPYSEKRFSDLQTRVRDLEQGIPVPVAPRERTPWAVVLTVVGSAVAIIAVTVTFGIHLDNKIGDIQKDYNGLSQHVGKLDSAVKALNSKQDDQTQILVQDLLASAQGKVDPKLSAKAALAAASLVAAMRTVKTPAPPEFFQSSIETLNNISLTPEVAGAAFNAKVALADYRSAIVPLPDRTTLRFGMPRDQECIPTGKDYPNHLTDLSAQLDTVNLVSINNCWQRLDNVRWHNVAFVNMRIRYFGGDLDLQNVIFANCTFDIAPTSGNSPRIQRFLDYAALNQRELTFPG